MKIWSSVITTNKEVREMTVNIGKTTTIAATLAVVILVAVMCFINISNTETKTAASIGGFSITPTNFDSVVTSDGAISIFAPAGVAGHWEIDGKHFSNDSDVFFCQCPLEDGVREYTFVPDEFTVRAITRGFAG